MRALIELYDGETADSKLPKGSRETSIPSEACESCHGSGALAGVTSDSTVFADDEGTVVNPPCGPRD